MFQNSFIILILILGVGNAKEGEGIRILPLSSERINGTPVFPITDTVIIGSSRFQSGQFHFMNVAVSVFQNFQRIVFAFGLHSPASSKVILVFITVFGHSLNNGSCYFCIFGLPCKGTTGFGIMNIGCNQRSGIIFLFIRICGCCLSLQNGMAQSIAPNPNVLKIPAQDFISALDAEFSGCCSLHSQICVRLIIT